MSTELFTLTQAEKNRDKTFDWLENGKQDIVSVGFYWDHVKMRPDTIFLSSNRNNLERCVQLHVLFYLMSGFDAWFITRLVDLCLGAKGNCDKDLWEMLFLCGLSKDAFDAQQALAAPLFTESDLFSVPLMPGGSWLLPRGKRNRPTGTFENPLIEPSVHDPNYHFSQLAAKAHEDKEGNVLFPLSSLRNEAKLKGFLRTYFNGALNQLWADRIHLMASSLKPAFSDSCFNGEEEEGATTDPNQLRWPKAYEFFLKIRQNEFVKRRSQQEAKKKETAHRLSEIPDIEDLPKCIPHTIREIKKRIGDHAKDPERFLIIGTLALRVPRNDLMKVAELIDDKSKIVKNHAESRKKQAFPSCSFAIKNGLCAFVNDGERERNCYSKMSSASFRSPVFLLSSKSNKEED